MSYLFHLGVITNLYVIVAVSFNLILGEAGLLSACPAAFYGIGAYTTTLLVMRAHWGFTLSSVCALAISGIIATCVGFPALRLRGDYFVLATIAFQTMAFGVFYNWNDVTGGANGIPGIPPVTVLGISLVTPDRFFFVSLAILVGVVGFCFVLKSSPFGRVLRAVRDDDLAAAALGRHVILVRLAAFVIGSVITSAAGALYSGYARYIDPTSFTINESIFMLSIVVIGGAGNVVGPILGAVLLVLLPEALRFLSIPDVVASHVRQILYGVALVLFMRFRPKGIVGGYGFR